MNYLKHMFFVCSFFIFFLKLHAFEEKKFVIVVTSFNNREWYSNNLSSIFSQKYSNYRVIYIDDGSDDGTPELVEHYIHASGQTDRCILIKNKVRKRALANLYTALLLCEPDEIVFNQDGDDWLAHENVFSYINGIYQDPNIWITYGQFINWPTGELGYCQELPAGMVEKQTYRQKWWKPGQLRTFYAWLFHQIKLKDLLFEGPYFQGQFFPANADLAVYYPMMEMAGNHYKFISDVIYIRNVKTPLNDFKANKEVQILGSKILRAKPKYSPLLQPQQDYFTPFADSKADLIIFSHNNAPAAQEFIQSCNTLLLNCSGIYLLYSADSDEMAQKYAQITSRQALKIIPVSADKFKEQVMGCIQKSTSDHILFAHDGMLINHFVDLNECIQMLEKTFSYSFFLSLSNKNTISYQSGSQQPLPPLNSLMKDIYCWAFEYASSGDWISYNNLEMTLYRKNDVMNDWNSLDFNTPQELVQQWNKKTIDLERIALCYEEAKIGYITWIK